MLGEIHSLVNDFPEMEAVIAELIETDPAFAKLNERYNTLDAEIRKLELKDAPISDEAMHELKHDRAELKDSLYRALVAAGG